MHSEIKSTQWVRKRRTSRMQRLANRHPFLCVGLPFLVAVVGGSLVLLPSQQTKYEVQDRRNRVASLQELKGDKRKFNLQEEYFRMKTGGSWGEWEPKRVGRPPEEEPVFDRYDRK
ncbi:Cytochrome oxidase assembly [Coemansia javaensis]|uniref:Cytochrome c oxidase assembly protein COX16, mitochondrial n=1 Tax=Coemansia javaensis TaxID=2761396 RepID=A0A9W8LEE7_9FUNG|nr:Cytochrome oxidase assembly [Coemansia javaensis]